MSLSEELRAAARSLIASRLGLDFPEQRGDDLERRLLRACSGASAADPASYLTLLARLPGDDPEWQRLADQLTIGETYFFRDRGCIAALEEQVLPALIERRRRDGTRRLRLWSAGCSTGEEPYSLAMLLDRLLPDRAGWSITILATDLNPRALAAARRGVYRQWSLRDTPDSIRQRYFHARASGAFELATAIRRMVTFAPLNLAGATYPSPATNTSALDLILCRNVIMYLTREAQRQTLARLRAALAEDGWLGLSPAEASAELLRPLEPVSFSGAVLFRNSVRSSTPPVPQPSPAAPAPLPVQRRHPLRPPAAERRRPPERPVERAALLERARAEADRGHLDHARTLCRDAIDRNRLDPQAHLLLAAIEQERGDPAAAIAATRSAIYLAPDSPSAHFTLGSLLLRQGDTAKAQASMAAVVSLLSSVPSDDVVDGADGLPAGRLLETAAAHLSTR